MKLLLVVVTLGVLLLAACAFCACIQSSRISREEERRGIEGE